MEGALGGVMPQTGRGRVKEGAEECANKRCSGRAFRGLC